jgi:hypothetical protein
MYVRFQVLTVASMKMEPSGISPCSLVGVHQHFRGVYCLHRQGDESMITLTMEAVLTSETSVYSSKATWRYIPEGSHLHTHRCENLKSHIQNGCQKI